MKKIISGMLALLMTLSAFVGLCAVPVSAANEEQTIDYVSKVFLTAEEKLATMEKRVTRGNYSVYVDAASGEIAYVNDLTHQAIFSNPYDLATSYGSNSTKESLLSQIIIKYTDKASDIEKTFKSYTEAALRNQITVKNIKNGIRVEYTIGREDTNYLVPRMITEERFENEILAKMPTDYIRNRVKSFYVYKNAEKVSERQQKQMYEDYPITKKYAIYVMPEDTESREIKIVEEYIKTYCPEYTFDELSKDHEQTEYVVQTKTEAVFKLSLEYTLDENGDLIVNLPANGIRFDSDNYTLNDIQVLPYMGAGDTTMEGYCFIPDGSGALFEFDSVRGKNVAISNSVYGIDYAYQTITGSVQRQKMRLPVFGVVENYVGEKYLGTEEDEQSGETIRLTESYSENRGYVAIIEEGDSLANICLTVGGALHKYANVYASFNPCPKDTYTVSGTATWTVTSSRKYTGNFKLRYIMLDDQNLAEENGIEDTYDTTWLGMAKAYRDYLEANGTLTRIQESDDIALYVETLGALDDVEKILSMPVTVSKALTSFEDVQTIADELRDNGISNINFRLSGYANGGLYSTVPYGLKWERSVGGSKGFEKLVAYAKENGIGIYPDFDFAYINVTSLFDGVSTSKHAIKTIDDRYANKQEYSVSLQTWQKTSTLCVSASVYERFFNKLTSNYLKYEPIGISMSTLGTDLNSDFDEDDPYNREDTKNLTAEIFESASEQYGSVMTDGGNAYSLSSVDHILNVALDSSDYQSASATVPFVGAVLHGYVSFAGSPINMAGDVDYEILRAIENGASPYFVISYSNNELIKEQYSDYYSVRYDIWKEEIIEIYTELNELLSDVSTSRISDHSFVSGMRIPDADEIEADMLAAQEAAEEALAEAQKQADKEALAAMRELYEMGKISAGESVDSVKVDTTVSDDTSALDSKYVSDDNRIVRVEYENGAAFLLNYNNFDVEVELDGETYTVESYGYVVLSKGGTN